MRVSLVHSFYHPRQPGGENTVVLDEVNALTGAGHSVQLVAAHTEHLEPRRRYPLTSAVHVATGLGGSPIRAIAAHRPDVVHIHNTFPNLGRTWVRKLDVPFVHTIHNFRPICAAATLYRDGHDCMLCPEGRWWSGLQHACYRDSRLATAPLTIQTALGTQRNPLITGASALIVLSERAKSVYTNAGVPEERLIVKPNFLPGALSATSAPGPRNGWLFVGRISAEKGLLELLNVWPPDEELTIIGDGPLASRVPRGLSNVRYLGRCQREVILRHMTRAKGLLFPSLSREGLPLVYLEALVSELPVLAWPGNTVSDLVSAENTGIVVHEPADLPRAMRALSIDIPDYQKRCRAAFDRRYSEEAHIRSIERIYRDACRASDDIHGSTE